MTNGLKTIIYPVKDLTKAKAVFGALLGSEPVMDAPFYVQFTVAGQDVGLNPGGHAQGMTGPLPFWHVPDVRASLAALLAAGAEIRQDVRDVGDGKLIASVTDADGNTIGLIQEPS